jgi:hypothetical protein
MSEETQLPSGFESGSQPIQPGKPGGTGGGTAAPRELKRNRADLIMVLGILSLFCCPPMGVIAWIMGSSDLRRVKNGTMSSDHIGTLRAGWVLGMVGTVFFAVWLLTMIFLAQSLPGSLQDLKGFLGKTMQGLQKNVQEDLKAGPLTQAQLVYAGEWIGNRGTEIKIYPSGTGDCKYRKDNFTSSQVGGIVRISGDTLSIGFFGLYSTWHIDQPPSKKDATWTMILDGEVFTKKWSIERPSPDDNGTGQRPREFEV